MDTTIKITSLHLVVGIITGIISTGFTLSWFGIKNDVFATALAFIILYFVGQLAQKQFGDEISRIFPMVMGWNNAVPCWMGYYIYFIGGIFINHHKISK